MQIHGTKASGDFGVLNLQELTALIQNHCPPGVTTPHPGHLATWVMNHAGVPGPGSGGTTRTHQGRQIFHHTCHGVASGGATIFICQAAPGVGSIVAVGLHAPFGVDTYNLHWRKAGWGSPVLQL